MESKPTRVLGPTANRVALVIASVSSTVLSAKFISNMLPKHKWRCRALVMLRIGFDSLREHQFIPGWRNW